ncbi:MAG: histidine kinase, partial [Bacteroidia bacterium]|nr:histidine kinase [Bacteroidia bacterium]
MKKIGIITGILVWLTFRQTLQGWEPRLWDGYSWKQIDSCTWQLVSPLPHYSDAVLQPGDELIRIDYQSICHLSHIPPGTEKGRLYLYEVRRQAQIYLAFIESSTPFPLGWPHSERTYLFHRLFNLSVLLLYFITLLFTLEEWRWTWQNYQREGGTLIFMLFLLIVWWHFWEEPWATWRSFLSPGLLSGWLLWTLLWEQEKYRWIVAPLAIAPFLLREIPVWEGLLAGAILGMPLIIMDIKAKRSWLYAIIWMVWSILLHPILITGMALLLLWNYKQKFLRSIRLLPREAVVGRLLSIGVGVLIGALIRDEGPSKAFLSGILSTLGILGVSEVLWRAIQARQRRVRLLQERLPKLWEIVDRQRLYEFIRETLQDYGGIKRVEIYEKARPEEGARPWMRRSGEPFPLTESPLNFIPDVLLPLPAYGWLFLQEGERRMSAEDIRRLFPFAAGISIALRHMSLFEAAHEARLAALRGQLSPHFLFNALNTLQALIPENPALAEELMTHLAMLLRRTLAHARHVTVSLEEELALVRDYLSIEKQRFGQRLQIEWNVPEPVPCLDIPPFAIQILVENVIKHAVSQVRGPVTLTLYVKETLDKIQIEVIDNGPGIDISRI